MGKSPEDYFSGRAEDYRHDTAGWLWSGWRQMELRAVLGALRPRPGDRVLDAGCGAGFYAEALAERGADVVATDLTPGMAAQVRKATGLPAYVSNLEDGTVRPVFDGVISCGALEFCRSPALAVKHLAEGLRPETGRLVLMVPAADWGGGAYRFFHARHGVRIELFSRARLGLMARVAGLRLVEFHRAGFNHVVRMEPFPPWGRGA